MRPLVLDTNVVLDLLVFADERTAPLRAALRDGHLRWLATPAMREELARVLAYPKIASRLALHGGQAGVVLQAFDAGVQVVEAPVKASVTCADPDDQIFIDLAVARRAVLLSKDRAVLTMRNRLARLEVAAQAAFAPTLLATA